MLKPLTATKGDNVEIKNSNIRGVVLRVNKEAYTIKLHGSPNAVAFAGMDELAKVTPGTRYDRKRKPYSARFTMYDREGTTYSGFEYTVEIREGRSRFRRVAFEVVRHAKGCDYLTRRYMTAEERLTRGFAPPHRAYHDCWEGDPKTGRPYRHKRKADAMRFALLNFCGIEWR
jgi:hypothetical protein